MAAPEEITVPHILALVVWLARPADGEGLDIFERHIRPALVEHCYRCHDGSAGKRVKGGLRLDSRSGWAEGGKSGPAIVPGDPGASLVIRAIRHDDPDLRMPPKARLSDETVSHFERWVELGAPDPRESPEPASRTSEAAGPHWAFQPLLRPPLPAVSDASWVTSPVDRFVLARLEREGLVPSPPAPRRTLIRRLFYDLIGLPPSAEEAEAFERDPSPDAYARLVDRLLASPHYGERWGRHWLDVARYADTKDLVLLYGEDAIRPYAYTYRDYVIRALNLDTPYDRFVEEQLAADRVASNDEPWRLAALGFLTLGRLFDNNIHDVVDDQIDTVTRGLLGLTVACARCHDHKYDPIPTEDYYSLYGVFASSERPLERPLAGEPARTPAALEFEAKSSELRTKLRQHIESQYAQITETACRRTADYLVRLTEPPDPLETAVFFRSLSPGELKPRLVARWRNYVRTRASSNDPVFGPWHDLMEIPEAMLATAGHEIVRRWRAAPPGVRAGELNPLVRAALEGAELTGLGGVARAYGQVFETVYDRSRAGDRPRDAAAALAFDQILEVLTSRDGPVAFPKAQTYLHMPRVERGKYHELLLEIDKLAVKSPAAPPRAMVLTDAEEPYEPRVFVRGDPSRPGKKVPRRFLKVLSGDAREPFRIGSGRLDLARAITARDDPLAARVMVNRVWMHHLGEPLVDTPSDFGARSSPPSHPDLLDHLAWSFVESGWSLKELHREILLSSTYRQSSSDNPECRRVDPDNRLLWRAHRQRLDLEALRDSLLAVSGRLDRELYGRPVDIATHPEARRRTVYGLIDRQNLPGLFRAFDFASPDQSAARRPRTIVPQQALFALNAPFVIEQVRALAHRAQGVDGHEPVQRIACLYRMVLAREPRSEEIELALGFIEAAEAGGEGDALSAWEQLAQVLLATNEFVFLD